MIKGIFFGLAACFTWGLIFVVPGFIKGFTAIEIALGPYFVYGILSLIIFSKLRFHGACKYPWAIWFRASYCSFIYTVGYYFLIVLAVRLSTPAICALIVGLSPITIAIYGNWKEKEISYKKLVLPAVLTLVGLLMINIPRLLGTEAPVSYVWGLVCSVVAVMGWSWYVVANSRFLKSNLQVQPSDWATLMGVTCLLWVGAFALFIGHFFPDQFSLEKCTTFSPKFTRFAVGSLIIGILSEWLATYFWNKASLRLPVSLAGQLTIFETIFGVVFFYILEQEMPPLTESIGIVLFLCSILYGVRQFSKIDRLS